MSVEEIVASLHERGFDRSEPVKSAEGARYARVGCSQCQAAVIQGAACHETGCRNHKYDQDDYEEDNDE